MRTTLAILLAAGLGPLAVAAEQDGESRGWLGVYLGGDSDAQGVRILKVIEDTPAEVAGIEQGDVIVRLNGRTIDDVGEFVEAVQDAAPGDEVSLVVLRDGNEENIIAVLGQMPKGKGRAIARIHALGEDDEDVNFDWDFDFDFNSDDWSALAMPHGNMGFVFTPGNEELHERIQEMIGDADAGSVRVQVECENGKGLITVERDDEVTTEEFDCEDMGDHQFVHKNIIRVAPHDLHLNLPELELKLEGLQDMMNAQMNAPHYAWRMGGEPSTTFRSLPDGTIEVTVTKGATKLEEVYSSAEQLQQERPHLYEQYMDLVGELDE